MLKPNQLIYSSITFFISNAFFEYVSCANFRDFLQPDDVDSGNYDYRLGKENAGYLCTRPCGKEHRTCYYEWTLEHYTTMGPGCSGCPRNITGCKDPQCVTADGFERSFLSVNRRLPGPSIQVCKDDTVIVDIRNGMIDKSVTIHWHGIRQIETPYMDGAPMITQCPIYGGQIFRYKFKVDVAGTFFWHSHSGLQKVDGIHGSLIVREPPDDDPNSYTYDYDLPSHVVFLSDWMHLSADDKLPGLTRVNTGQLPDTYLISGRGLYPRPGIEAPLPIMYLMMSPRVPVTFFLVKEGFNYRFRIVGSTCLTCPVELSIEKHKMLLIAADGGNSVQPIKVDSVVLLPGDRFDVVIEANKFPSAYWITTRGMGTCNNAHQVAVLKYKYSPIQFPKSVFNGFAPRPRAVVIGDRFDVVIEANKFPSAYWITTRGMGTCNNAHQVAVLKYKNSPIQFPKSVFNDFAPRPRAVKYMEHITIFPCSHCCQLKELIDLSEYFKTVNGPNQPCTKDKRQICISHLRSVKKAPLILEESKNRARFHIEFGFYFYTVEELFRTNTFERYFEPAIPLLTKSLINNISNVLPPSPLLSQYKDIPDNAFCSDECYKGKRPEKCNCLNLITVPLNSVVDIIITDTAPYTRTGLTHPFHLHGYDFYVLEQGIFSTTREEGLKKLNEKLDRGELSNKYAPMKDTIGIPSGGYAVIRFLADNPGFWFLHCHFIYHLDLGMSAVLQVGEFEDFRPVPVSFPTCRNFYNNINE